MGNGQNIIDKILSDAKAEAAKTEETARAEAEKIISAAQTKADKETQKAQEAGKDDAAKAAAKEISAAQMRAKQMILSAKQKCIEETVKAAKEQLAGLEGAEYKVVVLSMLTAAKPEKGSEVVLSAKDKEAFGSDIEKLGYTVSDETRPVEGGFIIKKGDIEYNYSFESIISVEKEEIDQTAAKILFA
jgi:V/A-type H+-transporting ATPase subunit E